MSFRQVSLHSLRKSDSENGHSLAEHFCNCINQNKPVLKKRLILFAENRCIMIILVELLCKFVCIVSYESWRVSRTSLGYLRRESVEDLDDTDFLRREFRLRPYGSKFISRYTSGANSLPCSAKAVISS